MDFSLSTLILVRFSAILCTMYILHIQIQQQQQQMKMMIKVYDNGKFSNIHGNEHKSF